jgi:hypothetical protein
VSSLLDMVMGTSSPGDAGNAPPPKASGSPFDIFGASNNNSNSKPPAAAFAPSGAAAGSGLFPAPTQPSADPFGSTFLSPTNGSNGHVAPAQAPAVHFAPSAAAAGNAQFAPTAPAPGQRPRGQSTAADDITSTAFAQRATRKAPRHIKPAPSNPPVPATGPLATFMPGQPTVRRRFFELVGRPAGFGSDAERYKAKDSGAMSLQFESVLSQKKYSKSASSESTAAFTKRTGGGQTWNRPQFADLFTKAYFADVEGSEKQSQSIANMRISVHAVRESLYRMVTDKAAFLEESPVLNRALDVFDSIKELFDKFPSRSSNTDALHVFIDLFMARVRSAPPGGVVVAPIGWVTDPEKLSRGGKDKVDFGVLGVECAGIVVVHRARKDSAEKKDFNVAVINTNNLPDGGINYHAVKVDPTEGSLLYNLSFELRGIENDKVLSTAFWLLMFKPAVFPNPKFGCKYVYEQVLPYLCGGPVTHMVNAEDPKLDCFPLPHGGDKSGINCVMESLRYVFRAFGASERQASHVPMLIRWDVLKAVNYELQETKSLTAVEVDAIQVACRSLARAASNQVDMQNTNASTVSAAQLTSIHTLISAIEEKIADLDERAIAPPAYAIAADELLAGACEFPLFGRFRREFDVESLAGEAKPVPIIRPVEMTLVPDRASDFLGVTTAMRHALNLCVLLANQRELIRNSYTLRVCMIQHLFTRVIPLPLPLTHPDRDKQCFWHAQPMRHETQADVLRLLDGLCKHFATASLSVKSTRSSDAVRIITFSCMATICDATLRKVWDAFVEVD